MPQLLLLKIHKLSKVISQLYGLRPSRADTSTLLEIAFIGLREYM